MSTDQVLGKIKSKLGEGFLATVKTDYVQQEAGNTSVDVCKQEEVLNPVTTKLFYTPLKNLLTLGVYDYLTDSEEKK